MYSCSTIIILHWLFHKSLRRLTLATHHFILTDSPRDLSTISYLGRQAFPNTGHFLVDSFKDAVTDNNAYGYILISVQPGRRKELAVCTNIFSDKITVYQQDPQNKSFKKMLLVDPSMVKDGILGNNAKTCNNSVTINGFPTSNGGFNTPETNSAMPVLQLPQGGHSTDISVHNSTPQPDNTSTSTTTSTTDKLPGAGDESHVGDVKDAMAQTTEGMLHPIEGSFSPLFLKGIFKKSNQPDHVCSAATSSSTQTDPSPSPPLPPPPPPPTSNTSSQTEHSTAATHSKGTQTKKRQKKKTTKPLPPLPPSPPPPPLPPALLSPPSIQPPPSLQPTSTQPSHKIVKKRDRVRGGIRVKAKHKLLKPDRLSPSQDPKDLATIKKTNVHTEKVFIPKNNISFKTAPKKVLRPSYGKRKMEDLVDPHRIAAKYRKTGKGAQPHSAAGVKKFYPFKNWYA